jgi:hypothetical protein
MSNFEVRYLCVADILYESVIVYLDILIFIYIYYYASPTCSSTCHDLMIPGTVPIGFRIKKITRLRNDAIKYHCSLHGCEPKFRRVTDLHRRWMLQTEIKIPSASSSCVPKFVQVIDLHQRWMLQTEIKRLNPLRPVAELILEASLLFLVSLYRTASSVAQFQCNISGQIHLSCGCSLLGY